MGWGDVAAVVLACVEKLAIVGNTVAVERDWVIVVAEDVGVERQSGWCPFSFLAPCCDMS